MKKIVAHGLKIDLHIHSCFSSNKDGKKVKENTIENVPTLVKKLNEQCVNICAITDHDAFSYNLYECLKQEEKKKGTIKKVLPGIEFSVLFENKEKEERVIHIVAIFNDSDSKKIKNIETVLKSHPQRDGRYTEEEFLKILRQIEVDTILIAHQKNTLSSRKARKNDANILGEEKFFEFVYTDYFEAFEFKNKRNEILNKNYLVENSIDDKVRFVTGTDCHDWNVYPKEDKSDNIESFPYTFAKCLPTFRGLVMAMTDRFRLKQIDSFFNADKTNLSHIRINSKGKKIDIPLSKGINVIIGDNSVGKSMLLHAITGYEKSGLKLPLKVKQGYKDYLKSLGVTIPTQLAGSKVFHFDMQGEVKRQFEENNLNKSDFLNKHFIDDINLSQYTSIIINEIDRLINYLKVKFMIDRTQKEFSSFKINIDESPTESLVFVKNLRINKAKDDKYHNITEKLTNLKIEIENLVKLGIDEEDKDYFRDQLRKINELIKKYSDRRENIGRENQYMEQVASAIDSVSQKHRRRISDNQKKKESFADNTEQLIQSVVSLYNQQRLLEVFFPNLEKIEVEKRANQVHEYEFVTKVDVKQIDNDYFNSLVKRVVEARTKIDWSTITEDGLKKKILKYDENVPVLDFFKNALIEQLGEDFNIRQSIINVGTDKSVDLSAGFNSQIYFDLLSYETKRDGVYIIDQPEDNVSQMAIKTYLLKYFKNMSENRQIIMVTHNPQFIVNLDIDNLIFLFKEGNELSVKSGALEYECDDYKILDIVADNIDGGLDSIQKRWKRYEKVNNFRL